MTMVEGLGILLVSSNNYTSVLGLTLYIGAYGTCDADRPQTTLHTPTQPIPPAKNSYLSAEKVKEIEYWLAEVDPEGEAGSLEVYAGPPFKEPQESWPRSILHRL